MSEAQRGLAAVAISAEHAPDPERLGNSTQATVPPSTPMMRQYLEIKALHPDAILFFRLGDFYEMFFDDALKGSELLQIALTSRSKGDERVPMCGVPYHSARRYIARLIEAGLRVAICDQVEEAGVGAGLVRREVVRLITPGMVLDDEILDSRTNNFLASVCAGEREFGAALLDGSTGEFWALEARSLAELVDRLGAAEPRELLVPEEALGSAWVSQLCAQLPRCPSVSSLDRAAFEPARSASYLQSHFQVASLEGYGLKGIPLATAAAGAALRYLKNAQKTPAHHVHKVSVASSLEYLLLDEATRANLEILRTLRDGGRKGSLLGVLDRSVTGMGGRKLSRWLVAPLRSIPEINARLDAVEELKQHAAWREELLALLRRMADMERICGRLALGAGNARDLRALANSLAVLPKLGSGLSRCRAPLLCLLAPPMRALGELETVLNRALVEEPPIALKEGGLIRSGYNSELDELIKLSTSGKDFLLRIEAREKKRTGINSLKVRYNKVFGYYLEVTRSNLHLVPTDYIRKQTTVGAERFITPELKEYEEKVISAEEKRGELEYQIFEELRERTVADAAQLRAAADAVATLDALLSLACCAAENGYQRPQMDESDAIEIEAGRHPVVEQMLAGDVFVPNDVLLSGAQAQILVITGPNMAGKSTVMRQVALIVLMAQAGSFVPAKRARIGLCDRIFTRVGAADNLAHGQSTFMVEMTETSNILHNATSRSLVLLDEIGRGTSTFDGLSIAWAVAEYLHDRVGARTLFATHYHELTDLTREKGRVRNSSVAVREFEGKVVFLRKLIAGGASRSYGIEVARLAGLPRDVVARAKEILANLEMGELDDVGRPRLTHRLGRRSERQLGLFTGEPEPSLSGAAQNILKELSQLTVDATSPLEALNTLARWKKALD